MENKNKDYSHADLKGTDMSRVVLPGADFISAACQNTDFTMADLSGARFWHADLTGANFNEANLQNADFMHAVLYRTNLSYANLKDAKFLTSANFKCKSGEGVDERGYRAAKESYAVLKQYFITHSRDNDISWAAYNENRMELRRLWEEKHFSFLPFLLMGLLCGWGEKPLRATVAAISIIVGYAFIYFALNAIQPTLPDAGNPTFPDLVYYSTITFTTVGYGDFLPKANGFYRLLAGSEAFIGIFMMGLFVFSLGRRYSSR